MCQKNSYQSGVDFRQAFFYDFLDEIGLSLAITVTMLNLILTREPWHPIDYKLDLFHK